MSTKPFHQLESLLIPLWVCSCTSAPPVNTNYQTEHYIAKTIGREEARNRLSENIRLASASYANVKVGDDQYSYIVRGQERIVLFHNIGDVRIRYLPPADSDPEGYEVVVVNRTGEVLDEFTWRVSKTLSSRQTRDYAETTVDCLTALKNSD